MLLSYYAFNERKLPSTNMRGRSLVRHYIAKLHAKYECGAVSAVKKNSLLTGQSGANSVFTLMCAVRKRQLVLAASHARSTRHPPYGRMDGLPDVYIYIYIYV